MPGCKRCCWSDVTRVWSIDECGAAVLARSNGFLSAASGVLALCSLNRSVLLWFAPDDGLRNVGDFVFVSRRKCDESECVFVCFEAENTDGKDTKQKLSFLQALRKVGREKKKEKIYIKSNLALFPASVAKEYLEAVL